MAYQRPRGKGVPEFGGLVQRPRRLGARDQLQLDITIVRINGGRLSFAGSFGA
jgi:hypothetical protein